MATEPSPPARGTGYLHAAAACTIAAVLACGLLWVNCLLLPPGGVGICLPLLWGAGNGPAWYEPLPDDVVLLLSAMVLAGAPAAVVCLLVGLRLRGRQKPGANVLFWVVCGLLVFLFVSVAG